MNTTELRKLLRERHAADPGNGPAWAYMEEVRDEASWDGKRTLDAVGLGLWKSRGFELHGYEIKASRGDLLKELKTPEKADPFFKWCDRFWLVCAPGICKVEEVPTSWGLLTPSTGNVRLRVAKQAPLNAQVNRHVDRSFLVCLLRAAGAGLKYTPERKAYEEARSLGYQAGYKDGQKLVIRDDVESLVMQALELQTWKHQFHEVFGVSLSEWRKSDEQRRREVIGALKAILAQDDAVAQARQGVITAAKAIDRAAEHLTKQAEWLREQSGQWVSQ